MKQQTAVEWVVWQLNQIIDDIPLDKWDAISVIVKRAKQMEEQEIKDAFHDGRTWNNSWNEETYFVEVYEKNGRYL